MPNSQTSSPAQTPAPAQSQPQTQVSAQTPTPAPQAQPPIPPAQTTAPATQAQPNTQQASDKSYLTPFWMWVGICVGAILLLSIGVLCTEEELSDTSTSAETKTVCIPTPSGESTTVNADLLTIEFAKFQKAVLDWNNVSGDSWRWDSWDRARQGTALAVYARAYDNLYIKHGIDAGHEARVLWVYATCMLRVSKAEGISYSEALDKIATKSVNELVSMLKKTALPPAYLKELNKFF